MRKIKNKRYILLFIITVLALLPIYAFSIEPNLFVVTNHRLNPEMPSNHDIIKIVQISDLHLKKFTANTDQTRHKSNKLKVLSRKDYIWQHIR